MSILIKGMEMPKDIEPGLVIEFADGIDGKRYARLYHYQHGGLTEWLEAISIPPHGRLNDEDAFKKRMMQGAIDAREDALTDEIWLRILDAAKSLCLDIDEQPTIIPASKEGE